MLEDMLQRLGTSGIDARLAVADTWGAAHALARFSGRRISISDAGEAKASVLPLPIASLRIAAEIVSGLHVLGFERVSDIVDQPRAPLTLRFGPELGRRIDQAIGVRGELIESIRTPDMIEVRRNFAEPIAAAETIARYIEKLSVELCAQLTTKGLGALRLDLVCHRVDSTAQGIRVGMAKPLRDAKRITRLLTDKIEKIDPGFGIEILALASSFSEPLTETQSVTSLIEEAEPDVSDLVDMLANRIGNQRIFRAAAVQSDVPERSVTRVPAMSPETGITWPGHWPRPSRLLSRPEPIDAIALLPDNPPVAFTWRGVRRRVRRADGPERVFGEWWKADAELSAVRDYFRVEDDAGERYWIFRAGDGEHLDTGSQGWFLHGVFG